MLCPSFSPHQPPGSREQMVWPGVVAYYFNAASAPAWGDNYIIKISATRLNSVRPLALTMKFQPHPTIQQQCRYGFSE